VSVLQRVLHANEILDQPGLSQAELEISLNHIAEVNQLLGGERSLIRLLDSESGTGPLHILDVGTGNAALPRALVRWARDKNIPIRVRATDLHSGVLEVAKRQCASYPEITVECADALRLPYATGEFTHALLTLALHHFEGESQNLVLRELARVSQRAAMVSELERCWPNYLGARVLAATWWRRDRITRHDGPLSVLRAFTPAELRQAVHDAGLTVRQQYGTFFYRLVVVIEPDRRAASATE
jgi:ubiquinone/menaquinone biosynthesis C-methylase UbiE